MFVSDPIADLLTRIRNGLQAKQRFIQIDKTKTILALVKILKEQGFIEGYLVRDAKPQGLMRIYLKYGPNRQGAIRGLRRISKPSCRRYVGYRDVPRVFGGMGISVLSTPKGIMIGREARREKVGGEVLCYVW